METLRRFFPWLIAVAGVAAVLKLDLRLHEPGLAVIAAFVLAGLLSSLRPRLAALWAAVAGGGLTASEAAQAWADPQSAASAPGILALLLLLPVAIGIAGAAAGEAMTEADKPRSREH
jgi:hypothetical protein